MPGGDGTGPLGRGSMTGRGFGFCAGFPQPGYERGIGFGRRFGRRYWRSGRRFWNDPYYPSIEYRDMPGYHNVNPYVSDKDEKTFLENMIKNLESRIKDLQNRIHELSQEKKE